jgi:outer membrane lipoprotein SlyB
LRRLALPFVLLTGLLPPILAGCGDGYSANNYASDAAQEEAAVQRGTIIGVRQITITPDGTVGAATGGAAGGVAGAQVAGAPVVTALSAIGGTLVGGIGGAAAAQAVGKTKGWEYIVQEEPGDKLVSVTQTSKVALQVGSHVLVIAGAQQARIVQDYTVQIAAAPPAKPVMANPANGAANAEVRIDPVLPDAAAAAPVQGTPTSLAPDPGTATVQSPAAAAPVTPAPTSSLGEAAAQNGVKYVSLAAGTGSAGSTGVPAPAGPGAASDAAPDASSSTVSH